MTAPEPLSRDGAGQPGGIASYAVAPAGERAAAPADPAGAERDDLRPAVAALLGLLAARTDPALADCLQRSREEWDQADSLSVIDDDVAGEIAALRRRLAAGAGPAAPAARRAIALEGLLVVDASIALVRLFERRLASLLRLRLRSATPDVLPGGRPFLDLGQALHEVAEAWR